ncbi:MAG: SURF1 family protein [Pseudomonadota bacterium]
MSTATFTFRPRWWAVLLTLLLAGVMVTAGFWQYGRGVHKQAMRAQRGSAAAAPARALLDDAQLPPRGESRRVTAQGMYLPDLSVLLDNQPSNRRPGVHAWTPFELSDGRRIVVDRGWLPLGAELTAPPAGEQAIEGHWKQIPQPGMRMGQPADACRAPRPTLVNYPDLAQVRCLFGESTRDGILELDASLPGGFERDWAAAGVNEVPPSRHFGYAAQWWLFAATLIALFIKINLKRKSTHD